MKDAVLQGLMIITMLLDGILQSLENSSLSSRLLIFFYSKFNSILCLVVLLEKVGILKDKNTSSTTFRSNELERGVSHQLHA